MITVANDRGFNDAADFGTHHASMHSPEISIPNLGAMLSGFDQQPAPVRPGAFMEGIQAEANAWGNSFGAQIEQTRADAASYWGVAAVAPAQAKPAVEAFGQTQKVTGLDQLGSLADSFANSLTGSKPAAPAMPEVGVEMASLSRSFGQIAPQQQTEQQGLTAFERRYQAPTTPRRNGNDYV